MAKKKETTENQFDEQEVANVVTNTKTEEVETLHKEEEKVVLEEVKTETPVAVVVKEEEVKKEEPVVEFTVDAPVTTAKNIVEDITLKTEFEVGDSVKIDDKPYKVVKVKITKSYDLEDQFGKVERNVYAHLVKDNSVNFAAFVAKSNEL